MTQVREMSPRRQAPSGSVVVDDRAGNGFYIEYQIIFDVEWQLLNLVESFRRMNGPKARGVASGS
jgi:hypothetical protein